MSNNNHKKIIKENIKYFDNLFQDIDPNIKLDYEQRKAIVSDAQYMMILAGAGSGKTTTITAKVKYLIEKKGVDASEILLLSFTNKAVLELKERINIDFGLNIKIKTFHSLGYEIIKLINKDTKIITNNEEILKKIIKNNINLKVKRTFKDLFLQEKFEETCISFVKLIKAKDYDIKKLEKLKNENIKIQMFINFIIEIYKQYQNYLSKNFLVDYDDLILKASEKVNLIKKELKYKYIIIDEYQDISPVRLNLIKKIVNLTNSKLIVVGDDWQSIYSFSGSEIDLFHDFLKFDNVEIIKITNTYRNSQELIDIAGKFIMKNKIQLRKKLKSNKRIKNPVEIIYYNDISNSYRNMIKKIKKIVSENNLEDYVILSRYNHDIEKINKERFRIQAKFMTVHSSKGLGFQNVILINMSDDIYGFPSKVQTNEYNKILISTDQLNEERRIFYVALTRTKNKVYILVPKSKPSIFIKEIEKYKNVKIVR